MFLLYTSTKIHYPDKLIYLNKKGIQTTLKNLSLVYLVYINNQMNLKPS